MPVKVKEMDKKYQDWAKRALVRPYPFIEPNKQKEN